MNAKITCPVCSESFKSAKQMNYHFKHHNQNKIKRYQCEFCSIKFLKEISLSQHCAEIHKDQKSLFEFQESDDNFHEKSEIFSEKCSFDNCNKQFSRKVSLKLHVQCVHTQERNYQCDICPSSFKTVSNLNVHLKMHRNQRDHKCNQCSKSFYTSSHLKDHSKIHQQVARFKCQSDGCNKVFIHASSFKKHQNFHEGLKNFSCDICHHAFSQNCHLRDHMSIHSNMKKHECSTCARKFRRADTLRIHQQVHTRRGS